jgi:uncharacterized protein involved in exopolysaccharide biosynthesis
MSISLTGPADLVRLLIAFPLRWLVPTVLVVLAAGAYAVVRPDTWEATQALIIRNEAANGDAPGKFRHADEMKTLLETVLELAKSRSVLAQTLELVGPPADRSSSEAWPSDEEITLFSEAFKIAPPKGAEFGTTEVFYLKVQDKNRRRAIALATTLCNQLEARYNQVRDGRAQSMVAELTKSVQLAQADLQAATARLKHVEQKVGSDLAELRHLSQASGGGVESDLRRKSLELESELRTAVAKERNLTALVDNLESSLADQGQLLATPNGLLESQPALRKLKEGLLDAQLRTAQLLGSMSAVHPQVIAAREAEQEIRRHLRGELIVAIRGVELDQNLASNRVSTLEEQLSSVRQRLELLAGLRSEYAGLVAEVDHRTKLQEEAQRQLVEARATQSSALTASLISRLDAPTTGSRPLGPGRTMLLLAGLAGGPVFGLAILLISLPAAAPIAVRPPVQSAKHGLSLRKGPLGVVS